MQVDIAETIRETLGEFQPVGLYGIGTLSLNHLPATFGNQRKSLHPPKMELVFSDSTTSNKSLINWLSNKYNIETTQAEEAFKAFCTQLLNALVNYEKVNLKGVGLLYKDNNKKLKCDPDKNFINHFYKGLPEIPVSLLQKVTNDSTISELTAESKALEKSNETESIETISSENITKTQHEVELSKSDETLERENLEYSSTNNESIDKIVQKTPERDNLKINVVSEQKPEFENLNQTWQVEEDSFFNIRNVLIALGLIALILLGYFGCNKIFNSNNDSTKLENGVAMDSINEQTEGLVDSSEMINLGETLPENCIIIVGSFKSSRNAIKMQDKLTSIGFDTYKETYENFTRVGFKFDCRESDLEKYLQEIRRSISSKAWYLDPSLYVEYEN